VRKVGHLHPGNEPPSTSGIHRRPTAEATYPGTTSWLRRGEILAVYSSTRHFLRLSLPLNREDRCRQPGRACGSTVDLTRISARTSRQEWRRPELTVFVEASSHTAAVRKIATAVAALGYGSTVESVSERVYNCESVAECIDRGVRADPLRRHVDAPRALRALLDTGMCRIVFRDSSSDQGIRKL